MISKARQDVASINQTFARAIVASDISPRELLASSSSLSVSSPE
jgi:hypothetical protein